jgi:ABC-type Na+ efflux pump, permease component
MNKFINIFRFEFLNYMKNKAFVGITLFLVVIAGAVLSFPRIMALFSDNNTDTTAEKPIIAVSGLPEGEDLSFFENLLPNNKFEKTDSPIDSIKADVDSGKYLSAIVITGDLSYQYIVKNIGMYDSTQNILNEALKARYQATELAKLGANADDIGKFLSATVQSETIQTASGKDQMKNFFYTYILIFALYMAILLYGQFVAMSVATEKSSRAMELLITSAKPTHLMFGKIFGAGSAGLLQFIVIFGGGYLFYNMNAELYKDNYIIQSIFNMPLEILLYALLFFVLGFFLYAFMYGALGSMVSRIEQLNTSIMPVTFLFIIAFMVVMFSMSSGNVDNTLMMVCSYVPFTSPMAMFVRIAMGNVGGLEVAISVVILAVSTVGIGYLAAGIYRMGVLMYGQPPKVKEIFAMMKTM